MKKTIILAHRWLGIPLSLVFVVWFVSGIVMMYAGDMPATSEAERLARAADLDLSRVDVTAADARAAAGVPAVNSVSLESVLGRPAYRFGGFRGATIVFADTGETLGELGPDGAVRAAAAYARVPAESVRFVRTVSEPDQWTLTVQGQLPLHRLDVDDAARTQIYVSPSTGDVALATTRAARALAWAGAIPHWFYFTPLRVNQPLWYWLVVWVSGIGCVLAALGIALGIMQSVPVEGAAAAPSKRYRSWMRWHYLSGIVFGIFVLTWVFSGMLSMEPFARSDAGLDLPRDVLSGGPPDLEGFPRLDASAWRDVPNAVTLRRIDFLRIQDEPYYLAHAAAPGEGAPAPRPVLVAAQTMDVRSEPFPTESILARVRAALDGNAFDGAGIEDFAMLTEYDAYYYSRDGAAPLPALRLKLSDADASWYYIDPRLSEIVYRVHAGGRWQRWLFNGLHSLDFAFWYDRRPLWDIGMIGLSLGALATTLLGGYLGIKRLRRDTRRLAARRS